MHAGPRPARASSRRLLERGRRRAGWDHLQGSSNASRIAHAWPSGSCEQHHGRPTALDRCRRGSRSRICMSLSIAGRGDDVAVLRGQARMSICPMPAAWTSRSSALEETRRSMPVPSSRPGEHRLQVFAQGPSATGTSRAGPGCSARAYRSRGSALRGEGGRHRTATRSSRIRPRRAGDDGRGCRGRRAGRRSCGWRSRRSNGYRARRRTVKSNGSDRRPGARRCCRAGGARAFGPE